MALTVSYTFTRNDYVLMSVALSRRPLFYRLVRAVVLVAVALLVGTLAGIGSEDGYFVTLVEIVKVIASGQVSISLYGIFGVLVLIALFGHWITGLFAYLMFRRMPTAGLLHEVELDEAEVAIRAPNMASTVKWSAIKRIVEDRTFFLMALTNRQAILLPQRAFPDGAAYAEALAFARSHVKSGVA